MNDAQILCISSLHQRATYGNLFHLEHGEIDIRSYITGDKGYPLLPWLMVYCKQGNVHHTMLEALFNKHLCKGRSIVEIFFRILN
jgi:hypothetical protein